MESGLSELFEPEVVEEDSSCNLEDNDFFYFDSHAALTLYGEAATYGLYLSVDIERQGKR